MGIFRKKRPGAPRASGGTDRQAPAQQKPPQEPHLERSPAEPMMGDGQLGDSSGGPGQVNPEGSALISNRELGRSPGRGWKGHE